MNSIKRYAVTLAFAVSPLFFFAQDTHHKYEQLPAEKNKEAKVLENYNKGIEHYNKAVSMITNAGAVELTELKSIQKNSMDEFKLALPYFENAYKLDPKDENTLSALEGIYFSLNDKKNYDKYKGEHDALRGK